MSTSVGERSRTRTNRQPSGRAAADLPDLTYESLPWTVRFINKVVLNPFRNYLIPAGLIQGFLRRSRSPLIVESLVRPGSWRSMEITYRNAEPVDWLDRLALRMTPITLASRNRRKFVTARLAGLIRSCASAGPVSILGVGAGPGMQVQSALVASGVDPARVSAWLVDLDGDAFEHGRQNAARLGIEGSIHFIQGDARRISAVLPHVDPQIVKLIGLAEYLTDPQLLELLESLNRIMPEGGALVTHGLVDAWRTGPFLARVFGFRHYPRGKDQLTEILKRTGFEVAETFTEPLGIFPILVAVKSSLR